MFYLVPTVLRLDLALVLGDAGAPRSIGAFSDLC